MDSIDLIENYAGTSIAEMQAVDKFILILSDLLKFQTYSIEIGISKLQEYE